MSKYRSVQVLSAPITERYWQIGCNGQVDETNNQIRVSGAWFPYDDRWEVVDEIKR